MTGPDFKDVVGDEGSPEELALLRRVHDLLVDAGPAPELSPRLAEPPAEPSRSSWIPRRRLSTTFVLAAAVVALAFGIGYLVANPGSSEFPAKGAPVTMHAPAQGVKATASILIGDRDAVGNWPILVKVRGLPTLPKGQWYELYLTRNGKPAAYCGSFVVKPSGQTTVQLSVPYKLGSFGGWIVTPSVPKRSPTVVLTT